MSKSSSQQRQTQEFGSTGLRNKGFIGGRTTVVTRGSGAPMMTSSRSTMLRSSLGGYGGMPLAAGTYANMSHKGVNEVKSKRESEKKDLQDLNHKLANYIGKIQFLEASLHQAEQELEYYRNLKGANFDEIKNLYENDLAQARKVIDDMASEKAGFDAKLAGLEDLVESQRKEIELLNGHCKDYKDKIDSQSTTIGNLEGELGHLRNRIENLEDENGKLRQINQARQDEIRNLRSDVDHATAQHIEADCRCATLEEENALLKAIIDAFPKEDKKPMKIKGLDYEDFWNKNMDKALRDIEAAYNEKLDIMTQEMEMRNAANLRQLQSSAVRDNMESTQAKEESKRLKSQMNGMGPKIQELENTIAMLERERSDLKQRLREAEEDLDNERRERADETGKLRAEMETVLAELAEITDAKLSLQLEIACYKKLLDGEEDRLGLKQVVDQAIGVQNKGASNLHDIVEAQSRKK